MASAVRNDAQSCEFRAEGMAAGEHRSTSLQAGLPLSERGAGPPSPKGLAPMSSSQSSVKSSSSSSSSSSSRRSSSPLNT